MTYQTTIKKLREEHNWTQEEFAERIGMSKNGYAKIERGESSPNIERLEKIAHALGVEVVDLFKLQVVCVGNENQINVSTHYGTGTDESLIFEIEKYKLMLAHKDEIVKQKDEQIAALKEMILLLKK